MDNITELMSWIGTKPDEWLESLDRRTTNGIALAAKNGEAEIGRKLSALRENVRSILEARRSVGAN